MQNFSTTKEELLIMREWINSIPSFFDSKIFKDFCMYSYGLGGTNDCFNKSTLREMLYPFIKVSPDKLKAIIIFSEYYQDLDTSCLGPGIISNDVELRSIGDIPSDELKSLYKQLEKAHTHCFVNQFDTSLEDWANQGLLLLNEFFIDNSWGFDSRITEEKSISAYILKLFLEEVHNLNPKLLIILSNKKLDYIKTYNINTDSTITGLTHLDFRKINQYLKNNSYVPISWLKPF